VKPSQNRPLVSSDQGPTTSNSATWLAIADIFASHDLGGWGKAGWLIFVIILPFLGVFIYLVARGRTMTERQLSAAQAQDKQFRDYIPETASEESSTDQLTELADLRDRGAITDQEFQHAKAGILTGKAA
jgi:Short C-terminal domain/Phospholipase_D-nuclease N-terminal